MRNVRRPRPSCPPAWPGGRGSRSSHDSARRTGRTRRRGGRRCRGSCGSALQLFAPFRRGLLLRSRCNGDATAIPDALVERPSAARGRCGWHSGSDHRCSLRDRLHCRCGSLRDKRLWPCRRHRDETEWREHRHELGCRPAGARHERHSSSDCRHIIGGKDRRFCGRRSSCSYHRQSFLVMRRRNLAAVSTRGAGRWEPGGG